MAEYSKEKLFFLKLPKDFFDKYYVKIIEGMPNGKDYLIMLLKLMCESISHGGYLRFSEEVAYWHQLRKLHRDGQYKMFANSGRLMPEGDEQEAERWVTSVVRLLDEEDKKKKGDPKNGK